MLFYCDTWINYSYTKNFNTWRPGIRTTVFMKGCNMRCAWCHNPESINCHTELMYYENKCIGCNGCREYLSSIQQNLNERFDSLEKLPKLPNNNQLKSICFSEALQLTAKEVSVAEVIVKLLLDKPFYGKSGRGITVSGGEPALQFHFIKELLKECKKHNLHNAIATNLLSSWSKYEELLSNIDLFMVDLKIYEDEKHKKYTGVSNKRIMKNFYNLDKADILIIIRTPFIKGINDIVEEITNICRFLKNFKKFITTSCYHTIRLEYQKQKLLD